MTTTLKKNTKCVETVRDLVHALVHARVLAHEEDTRSTLETVHVMAAETILILDTTTELTSARETTATLLASISTPRRDVSRETVVTSCTQVQAEITKGKARVILEPALAGSETPQTPLVDIRGLGLVPPLKSILERIASTIMI